MQSSTSDSNDTAPEIENFREEMINETNSDKLDKNTENNTNLHPLKPKYGFYLFSFYF